MLALVVSPERRGGEHGTASASPSAKNPTRTGEPVERARCDEAHSAAGIRLRNPERYQIIAEHARGGLGRVSRALDRDLDREIAIKEMLSGGHLGEVRFLREAMITARLQHPGIVPIYEAGRWPDGTPFYAMKLVAGRPLRDLIADATTVDQRIGLLHHVIAVADAIAYAHGRNIIHRDLKPANIIVGDFGETIVIDWGLAKDLSAGDESRVGGGPFRTVSNDLTAAGHVMGTPSYMAPEQERGEPVDQRADVFAIGAMLWELCSITKVPPVDLRQRHRMLRRAGIDRDLAAIVDKALDPDRERRYRDAGALSADLKAFKSGARIAARTYSPLAMLGHWVRRHRALAASVVGAVALSAASGALYVRNITRERDRAEASSNRLLLKHAELLLRGDPTAAFDLLRTYSGSDANGVAMLRAEAQGLGLSSLSARPHTQWVLFAHALADGSLITLAGDGTVANTAADGTSRVIARGLTAPYAFDYVDRRHLLAYGCDASGICLLDVQAGAPHPLPSGRSAFTPVALAFSPSGDRLAAISAQGETMVSELSSGRADGPAYQATVAGARSITFVDEDTLAVQAPDRVELIHLDGRPSPASSEVAVAGGNTLDASPQHHVLAVGTADGALVIIDGRSNSIVRRETICKGPVNKVLVIPARSSIAYGCHDGDAGTWDLEHHKLTALAYIEGGAVILAGAADGRFLLVGGSSGKLVAYDFTTQMVRSYLGHTVRLSMLLPPSSGFPHIASGDTLGNVRIWSPPDEVVRVAIATPASMYKAMFLAGDGPMIAFGASATIPWYARNGATGALQGHDPSRLAIAVSPAHPDFAMYGDEDDDEIELWSLGPQATHRTVKVNHGAVTAATFTADGGHVVTGARDGAITEWSTDGETHRERWTIHQRVEFVRSVPGTNKLVIASASGGLWLGTATGLTELGPAVEPITSVAHDSKWLAVGTAHGAVRLYNLVTGESQTVFNAAPSIEYLALSHDGASLAIVTRNKVILLATPGGPASENSGTSWQEIELAVKHVAFSPDDTWLAATCDHGDIWFYRRTDHQWVYRSVGNGRVPFGRFSDDGSYFVANDLSGRALLIDMRASVFERAQPSPNG